MIEKINYNVIVILKIILFYFLLQQLKYAEGEPVLIFRFFFIVYSFLSTVDMKVANESYRDRLIYTLIKVLLAQKSSILLLI